MLYFEASVAKRFHGNEKVELSERGANISQQFAKASPFKALTVWATRLLYMSDLHAFPKSFQYD